MPPLPNTSNQAAWLEDHNYTLLRIYAYYRTILSSLFLLMFAGGFAGQILGTYNPALFLYTAMGYTFVCVLTLAGLWRTRFSPRREQLFTLLFLDTVALVVLMHASGGTSSGLGFLLLVTVASASIFLDRQLALLLAAISSLLIISETLYTARQIGANSQDLFVAGMLGGLLFVTALLFRVLTGRLQASQRETAFQAHQAAQLARLAKQTVERMNTGIIAINGQHEIQLMNRAARRLLGIPFAEQPSKLLPAIRARLEHWKASPHSRTPLVQVSDEGQQARINFAQLSEASHSDILIFLEDTRQLSQQAQQLKLASLGRLTASIAHEVRNPLGAISHASQLLAESGTLDPADVRLTEIIATHSLRVNQIIENVLQLSSRKLTEADTLDLQLWLPNFVQEYQRGHPLSPQIEVELVDDTLLAKADASQLQQILINLCDNGLRYSLKHAGSAQLTLLAGRDAQNGLAYIDVIDAGPGLSEEQLNQAFEPFYTSEAAGSGLGLYICKELCEANEASLAFKRTDTGESCFRITLAHQYRVFN